MKRTKIVCTIGPASETKVIIEKMVRAGLNVARLNFSHGVYKHHQMLIDNIRSVSKNLNQPVAIMQDLQGPRIRIGEVPAEGIPIKKNQELALVPEKYKFQDKKFVTVPTQYPDLYKDIKKGHEILVEDGTIVLQVTNVKKPVIFCRVKSGSLIKSHKGMNFPGVSISAPAITDKDKKDLVFGIKNNVDFVALSFVKDDKDIIILRKLIANLEKKQKSDWPKFKNVQSKNKKSWPDTSTKIIAKIERPEAIKNFEKILKVVDGIMVARGDLGLEAPIQDLPLMQKKIVRLCNQAGKPVIVATQMLDSMIRNPMPTRAEVTDVANAILDGTDGIMLSGETATGQYPLQAVEIMNKIANRMEATQIRNFEKTEQDLKHLGDVAFSFSFATQDIAEDIKAKLIVCVTIGGFSARLVSRFKPKIPVIGLTPLPKTRNQLALSWGVQSYDLPYTTSFEKLVSGIKKIILQNKLAKAGDQIVLLASYPLEFSKKPNLVSVVDL
ncbi:MAG: pyruvate kinase [Candidatus Buchananbacteria bacterium]|nr:pyruvate kinase [Candidatus Buchananbacteria bacterium]